MTECQVASPMVLTDLKPAAAERPEALAAVLAVLQPAAAVLQPAGVIENAREVEWNRCP